MEQTTERRWGWLAVAAGVLIVVGICVCVGGGLMAFLWLRPASSQLIEEPALEWAPPTVAVAPNWRSATPTPVLVSPTLPPVELPAPPTAPPMPPTAAPTATEVPGVGPAPMATVAAPTPAPLGSLVVDDFSLAGWPTLVDEAVNSPEGREVRITVHQEKLNTELQAALARSQQGALQGIRDVRVEFAPGELRVTVRASLQGGIEAPITITAQVGVRECRLVWQVTSVRLGGFPAPGAVRNQVEQMLRDNLQPWLDFLPVCLEEVVVGPGYAFVRGRT
ncbi:MAG: hypothetical protein GX605_11215 [Chloroflexi bacterium]|nr:hypothetical protein [Chloroflexota bacterium]